MHPTQVDVVTPVATDDPMDDAFNPKPRFEGPRTYYGQVHVGTWYCMLVKGAGKVKWNPDKDPRDQRRTAIDISVDTLDEMGLDYLLSRQMIAESNEWNKIVLPSVKALGVPSLAAFNGAWAALQFAGTGRKYQSQYGEKEATTFKFLSLYGDEASCRAAYRQEQAARGDADDDGNGNGNGHSPAPEPEQPQVDPARDVALGFLKVLCAQHKNDPAALQAAINSLPQIAKYFTVNSPETQAYVREAQGIKD